MTRAALHLNDAAVTLLTAENVLYRQPGYAWLHDGALDTGDAAFARARVNPRHVHNRYWRELDAGLLRDQFFTHLSAADLASHQLESLWQRAEGIDELVVAVPAWLDGPRLSLFLGIAAEIGMPVSALADAAAAATRREYRNAVPIHVDIGLHCTSLTRIGQAGQARVERAELIDGCGLHALYDAWVHHIAEAFVKQSRYDPLHAAETEQVLLDQLDAWLARAGREETVAMQLEAGGITHTAEVEAIGLINAAAAWYQQIANRLRALCRAQETPALQLSDRVARLPGLADMLKARLGGEVFALEAGATARGALARCPRRKADGEGVSLLRQLPWDQSAMEVAVAEDAAATGAVPTHLLFRDVAWPINAKAIQVGTQPDRDARAIDLPADMPGISRRHCDVRSADGQCVVEDHSRYGTFLNGHRIDGSAVLQVGDSLRVGTPGFEFRLITTDENHAA